ncbi:PREDICTED: U4/U6.U5 small nuclear ribonucleoprotein 27 kDa protein isoform X1 [Myotis davidii]|uniref:U4/U6.U5 small nuclear ribonucleoprotein 27 kDa protein isoform X1 n=1 Tax=Myotis davidii TaxID=225400 RepID=UPI000767870C|nr:PREDICTED: U4/U6.U5 small nuclear ribonucleoprotein 27 kDa protein isoform X1 [Myotis davidii]
MGRSRSRSPRRERRRSRSTSRERERRRRERSRSRERDRRRSRSRSPHRRRSRSPRRHRSTSPSPSRLKERRDDEKKETKSKERQITEEDLEGKTEEEIEMMKIMGFASFDSTKAVHESQRWIQQTFGFHCVRIEMLKNDFSPLIMIRVDFVFCISYASKQDRITALPPCKEVSFGAIINPIFCLIPVEAVYVFFLDAR